MSGPYVVASEGDWIDGNEVTIRTDDVRTFGYRRGTVWIVDAWKWAVSTVRVEQEIVHWRHDQITIRVSGAAIGRYVMVFDADGNQVRFCLLEGRAIRRSRLRIGVNVAFHRYYNSFAYFANLAKHASGIVRHEGAGSITWDDLDDRTRVINAAPGLVAKMPVIDPRQIPPRDSSLNGRYVVRWDGDAECAYGTMSKPLSAWHKPGSTFVVSYPPVGNDDRATLFFRNATSAPIDHFVSNVTMCKVDGFASPEDALASWDAGVEGNDERIFNPAWLAVLREWNVRGVRTMDWSHAHLCRGASWKEGATPMGSMIWTMDPRTLDNRVPYEVSFALAKAIDAEALYVCIPARANDGFFDRFAAMIERLYGNQLRAGKRLFVERSNEAWNFGGGWAIGAMQLGAQFIYKNPVVRCVRDPSGAYRADGDPFVEPMTCIGIAASGAHSLALKTYSGTSTDSATPARDLTVKPISGGLFDIINNVANRKVTDEWVDLMAYRSVADGKSTFGGTAGIVDAQADTFAQLRARLPAEMYANVVKFLPSQTVNGTLDRQMDRWARMHQGEHGPLEAVSVAPYYDDNALTAYIRNNPGEVWRTFEAGVADADALSPIATDPTADATTSGNYIVNNWRLTRVAGRSYSGWNPEIWCYEGGNHTLAGASVDKAHAALAQQAADCPEGGDLMRYWLHTMAATDAYEFVWHYNDLRHDIFGIRRKPEMRNRGRDALMQELQGEI